MPTPATPDLVLFDLDHTLLDGDSNQLWLGWLVERGAVPEARLAEQLAAVARGERRMPRSFTAGSCRSCASMPCPSSCTS